MKILLQVTVASLIFLSSCISKDDEYALAQDSFDEYLGNLLDDEKNGGSLFCENDSGGVSEDYRSCKSFYNLKERECYGRTTLEMNWEYRYADICQEIEALEQASISTIDYFDLESIDWWKTLPAEVIPLRGGIYTQESWEKQNAERENLVTGKLLGDIDFVEVTVELKSFEAILSSEEAECGKIIDYFYLNAVLLADFNRDGVSELLLHGFRAYQSESCGLGSGNNLGGWFSVIINKDSLSAIPTVVSYLNED